MRSPGQKRLLVAMLVLLTTGCATLGSQFEAPSVSLVGIRLQELQGFEATFLVDLRVINPNQMALPVQGIVCDLSLNGNHLAKGVANPDKEIPAYGSEMVTVSVYASLLDMVGVAQSLIRAAQSDQPNERIAYGIDGSLKLADRTWPGKIPFKAKGEIRIEEMVRQKP